MENLYFPQASAQYIEAGWKTVVPLPHGRKSTPPTGFTGNDPKEPTEADYVSWAKLFPNGNTAIVVPDGWLGFDVDTYNGKEGYAQWFEFWDSLGLAVPDETWVSSARNPKVSGIRWYRVPKGYDWESQLSSNIEIIRPGHRYAVVYPSIHPEGMQYKWYAPGNLDTPSDRIPGPAEPLELPSAALSRVMKGKKSVHQPYTLLGWTETEEWLNNRPNERMCHAMATELQAAVEVITTNSVHDPMVRKTQSLIHLAAEGCSGVVEALNALFAKFKRVSDTRGDRGDYQGEWMRAVIGAVSKSKIKGESCWCPGMSANVNLTTGEITESDEDGALGTSWDVENLAEIFDANYEPLLPTMMTCTNGVSLLYPGRSHSIAGESGSGKTMIALGAAAQAIMDGKSVLILDFESDIYTVIRERLAETFGVPVERLKSQVKYLRPDERPVPGTQAYKAFSKLVAKGFDLVILDGVTNSIGVWGGSGRSEDDVAVWRNELLVPFEKAGSAVLMIDHVTKNAETRGKYAIGSQGKKGILTGAGYIVETTQAFGRNMRGSATLTLMKDRNGQIEQHKNESGVVATFVLDAREAGNIKYAFHNEKPLSFDFSQVGAEDEATKNDMVTYVQNNPGCSQNKIAGAVKGKRSATIGLLQELINEGRIVTRQVGQSNRHYTPEEV